MDVSVKAGVLTIELATDTARRWPAIGSALLGLFLLGGMMAGGVYVTLGLADASSFAGQLLFIGFLHVPLAISVCIAYVAVSAVWRVAGKEAVQVDDAALKISRALPFLRRTRTFALNRVDRIVWEQTRTGFWALEDNPLPLSTGETLRLSKEHLFSSAWMWRPHPAIAVVYEGKKYHFAVGLGGRDVASILARMEERLPEGVVRVPGKGSDAEAHL